MDHMTCYLGYEDAILTSVHFTMMGYKSVHMNAYYFPVAWAYQAWIFRPSSWTYQPTYGQENKDIKSIFGGGCIYNIYSYKKKGAMLHTLNSSLKNSNYHISMHNIWFSIVPQDPTNYVKH